MVMSGRGGYGVAMEEGSSYLGFDTNNLRNWHNWTTTKFEISVQNSRYM